MSKKNESTLSRRQLFIKGGKTSSVLAAGTWLSPTILSVAMPAHAQASRCGTLTNSIGGNNGIGSGDVSESNLNNTNSCSAPAPRLQCALPLKDTASIAKTRTDFNKSLSLTQYNPLDGKISKAVLSYDVEIVSDIELENREASPQSFELTSSANIYIIGPNQTVIAKVQPSRTEKTGLAAYDGTTDFKNASGTEMKGIGVVQSGSVDLLSTGINVEEFIGNGKVQFNTEIQATSEISKGTGNRIAGVNTYAKVTLSISYECELP